MRSGSPLTTVGSSVALEAQVGEAPLEAIDERGDERVELDVVEAVGRTRAARELDDVADERGQLVELGDDVGAQVGEILGREPIGVLEHLDVGAQARDRRAQLVARVGDEVALRRGRASRARRACG